MAESHHPGVVVGNPIDGAVENLEKLYDIAKMIAPTIVFFDEGDALAPRRSASGGSPTDKLTNSFLNLIDGEIPLNRVFTVLTTNRLDILDPALIRSKRLKVMEISGHLRKKDIAEIIEGSIVDIPLAPDLGVDAVVDSAQGICNTPADYAAFVEKACSLRSTEYAVLLKLRSLGEGPREDMINFVKFNFKKTGEAEKFFGYLLLQKQYPLQVQEITLSQGDKDYIEGELSLLLLLPAKLQLKQSKPGSSEGI